MNSLITNLEELSLNAWPGHQTLLYAGWILRFAGGYTQRANSITPLYSIGDELPLLEKIKACEELYTSKGLATIFKLTPVSQPTGLEEVLAARGYSRASAVSVQTADIGNISLLRSQSGSSNSGEIKLVQDNELKPGWLEAWLALSGTDAWNRAQVEKLLGNIVPDHSFMRLEQKDQVVALGLAVYELGYVGLFDIVTAAHFRRQGWGKRLIVELLRWGQVKGAETAYLQVLATNLPATRLYAGLGFREVYQYWYRVKQFIPVLP
jgi:GNAT superfamily N-acetyltransferase